MKYVRSDKRSSMPVHLQLEHLEESLTKTIYVLCKRVTLLESILLKEFGSRRVMEHYSIIKQLKANYVQLQFQMKVNELQEGDYDESVFNMDTQDAYGVSEDSPGPSPDSPGQNDDEYDTNSAILPHARLPTQIYESPTTAPGPAFTRSGRPVGKNLSSTRKKTRGDRSPEPDWEAGDEWKPLHPKKRERDTEDGPKLLPNERPICDQCGASFSSAANMRVHQRIHLDLRKFKCDECDEAFRTDYKLAFHKKSSHSTDRRHRCHMCPAAFSMRPQLVTHLRVHADVRKYVCELCSKTYKHKTGLNRHMLQHKQFKPFSCPECPNRFYESNKARRHLRTVHKIMERVDIPREHLEEEAPKTPKPPPPRRIRKYRRVVCDICGACVTAKCYRHHLKTHGTDFQCGICLKGFPTENALQKHQTFAHDPSRPYACKHPDCDERFLTYPTMRTHMLRHAPQSAAYRHKCKYCGIKYKHLTSLNNHINARHTHEKLYPCTKCLSIYHNTSHLKRHLLKVHKMSEEELRSYGAGDGVEEMGKDDLEGAKEEPASEVLQPIIEILDPFDIQQVVEIPSTESTE